jgi:hypothetical protein
MKKSLVFSILFFIFAIQLFGQGTLSLEQRMNYTDLIIEGKVVKQTTFLENNNIFTRNEVVVYKQFKGNYAGKYISIITEGGRYGDRESSCDHCLGLSMGAVGIFLAKERPVVSGQEQYYNITLGNEGFYRYWTQKEHFVAATYQDFHENRTDLHRKMEKIVGQSVKIIAPTEDDLLLKQWFATQPIRMQTADYCVQYEFKNLQVRYINMQIQVDVDVYVSALRDVFKLTKSKLAFQYASTIFGSNIVGNQHVTVTKGQATQQPNYQLTLVDISADKFYLNLESGITDPTVLESIGNNPEALCHIRLQVANIAPNAVLFFNPDALNTESKYYNSGQDMFFECYRNLEPFSGTVESLLTPTNITLKGLGK